MGSSKFNTAIQLRDELNKQRYDYERIPLVVRSGDKIAKIIEVKLDSVEEVSQDAVLVIDIDEDVWSDPNPIIEPAPEPDAAVVDGKPSPLERGAPED